MPTTSEMFEILAKWHQWNGADHRARQLDAEARHTKAEEYRSRRDQHTVDPIEVLSTAHELIQRLAAGHWDTITEARLRGSSWREIARAIDRDVADIRQEYTAMVEWINEKEPNSVGSDRLWLALEPEADQNSVL